MSTAAHRTSTRPSAAVLTSARQRQGGDRTGSRSGNSAEHALLRLQASAGNRAATAAVQRARAGEQAGGQGSAPQNSTAPAGAQKKNYRDRIAGLLDRFKKNLDPIDTFIKGVQTPANAGFTQQAAAAANEGLKPPPPPRGPPPRRGTCSPRPPAPWSAAWTPTRT